MARKKDLTEVQQAERRLQRLIERRDGFNADARVVREERDLLNAKKGEVRRQVRALRDRRSGLLKEVREHKTRRDDLQRQAKELIQVRRQLRGRLKGGVEAEIRRRRVQIQEMETRQETTSLKLAEETRLLESLRVAREELVELEALQREHEEVLRGVGELDAGIDDHFQRAEVEHREVLRGSELAQEVRGELEEKQDELVVLTAEANRIHRLFKKVKERADHYHQKAMEMRKEVITIKRARRRENVEGKVLLKEQKAAVRKALEDEEELDQAVDDALATLRKGGKLEL
ncbi:MAG: hypothetical protein ACE5JE_08885 [Thermoplasmata archaeon]